MALSLVTTGSAAAGAQGRSRTTTTPPASTSSTSSSTSSTSSSTTSSTSTTSPSDGEPGPGATSSTVCPNAEGAGCPGGAGVAPTSPAGTPPGARPGADPRAGAAARAPRRRWRGSVRPRRPAPRRPVAKRALSGPLVRVAHQSVAPGAPAAASVGSLGSAAIDPLPVGEDEEYVGPPLRVLVPLLALAAGLLLSAAALWERSKDRRVSEARRALSSRLSDTGRRGSEVVS